MRKFILYFLIFHSIKIFGQQGSPILIHSLGGNYPRNLYLFNEKLYFSASTSISGNEMWVYDNKLPVSSSNPKLLIDLDSSSNSTFPRQYIEYNGKLFFTNNNALYSYSDNQPISKNNPKYICQRANGLSVYDNKLYFEISSNSNRTIWEYDDKSTLSTVNPKQLVNQSINPIKTSNFFKPFVFQNKMIFAATNNSTTGDELWIYDKSLPTSASNPKILLDINLNNNSSATSNGSKPNDFIQFKNKLYFSANDGTGSELWVYDGVSTPKKVYDIDSSPYGGLVTFKTILNDTLFFSAHENQFGTELWKYDGENSPVLALDIYSGNNFSIPSNLNVFGNKLIFNADNGTNGRELWCYDNLQSISSLNPFLINDLSPGINSGIGLNGTDNSYVIYDNLLYFGAYGNNNDGLWALSLCDIRVTNPPVFSLGKDLTIYVGDSVILSGPLKMKSYSWSNDIFNNYQTTFKGKINNIGNNNIKLSIIDSNHCIYSDTINITVYSLENFNLLNPSNNSINVDYSLLSFNWSNNIGAVTYEVIIDTNQYFTGNPQNQITIDTFYKTTLLPSKKYFWKVRASNGKTWGQWSTVWDFTTKSNQISSINEVIFSDLEIYPNPTTDIITIETNQNFINKPYKLLNNKGQEIVSGIINCEQFILSLKNVSNGIYVLKIGDFLQQNYKIIKE